MKKILVVAAHADDEVLGCGGTILKHIKNEDEVFLMILADGESSRNQQIDIKHRNDCLIKASKILGIKKFFTFNHPDNQMDTVPLLSVTKNVETIIEQIKPDIIYTHHYSDLNIDHQIVHRAVMTACRPNMSHLNSVKEIYSFYVSSSTEWSLKINNNIFRPEKFVCIKNEMEIKLAALKCYDNEMRRYPHPRSYQAVENLARYWGNTVGLEMAEVFAVERSIWM